MVDSEIRSSKRSRFDQTESEVKRTSRFDRRSRSPSTNQASSNRRSRSPMPRDGPLSPVSDDSRKRSGIDPAAAAAAAAARINASIQAKKGIQHVDVPPILSAASPPPKASSPHASGNNMEKINGDMYIADGDYIKDIEVNDLRNRYTLTKGSTQKMIKEETGADVTTRGNYYPDKRIATAAAPPLYLHITSTSKEGLEKAVARVEELMKQELPNLVDERRFKRREPEPVERDEFGRRKWPEERITIDFESLPGFNLRAQVVGHGGAYVKHIQQETRCRVQIKGRGSGFTDHVTGQESDEPMYLHVAGPDPKEVQRAKELCEDLLANVREQYQRHKENPPQRSYGGGGGYGPGQSDRPGGYGGYGTGYGAGYGSQASGAQSAQTAAPQAPPGAPGAGGSLADYSAAYYGGADPYAAYGGYQNYMAYYASYYQQAAQQQPAAGAPPGPPPNDQPPPPPPPGGSPLNSGYNAVPPPPGL